jgi:dUTPase
MPQYNGSDGYYLFAAEHTRVKPNETVCFATDLTLSFPANYYDIIEARLEDGCHSNMSFVRRFYDSYDSKLEKNYTIMFYNHNNYWITVNKGDRVAKLLLVKIANKPEVVERPGSFIANSAPPTVITTGSGANPVVTAADIPASAPVVKMDYETQRQVDAYKQMVHYAFSD